MPTNHNNPKTNVCTGIVANNLCIGCGMCAAICPHQNLRIQFNEYGQYVACEQGNACPDTCSLCLDVCPFSAQPENEDTLGNKLFGDIPGIEHTAETGYYLESFAGYSEVNGHRQNGASGGLATFMLETLLRENLVDQVACVSAVREPEKLFKFVLCGSAQEVRDCSGSCYYPVEVSEIVRHILSSRGKYAIIGLPCFIKAFRLAMQQCPELQQRIRFLLGLVCGQTKSKFFSEYICAMNGGKPRQLQSVTFRVKDPNRPASDFGMKSVCTEEKKLSREGVVFWTEGVDRIWSDRYFTPNACNFCDDLFAELADVSFMDAWLRDYSKDPKGHNIVIVRNKQLTDIFNRAAGSGAIKRTYLNITQVVHSQQPALGAKRADLLERRRLAESAGQVVPPKRFHLCKPRLSPVSKILAGLTCQISHESPVKWIQSGKSLKDFEQQFLRLAAKTARLRQIHRYMRLPIAVFRKIREVLSF